MWVINAEAGSCLGGNGLDLKDGSRKLRGLGVHGCRDSHGGEGAADDTAGEPQELCFWAVAVFPVS